MRHAGADKQLGWRCARTPHWPLLSTRVVLGGAAYCVSTPQSRGGGGTRCSSVV